MKYMLATLCLVISLCQAGAQSAVRLKSQKDSISYLVGMNIGKDFQRQAIELNIDILAQAIKDMLAGKAILNEEQSRSISSEFQKINAAKREERVRTLGGKNKKEGEKFLSMNKTKEGVQTTPSGLQYKIIRPGVGESPTVTQVVVVNYRGTLIDGTEFDNSYNRNKPTELPVNRFIKGWQEALQMMQIGSEWELYIPPELAYGEQGYGQSIPPNATLIFELELIAIK